MAIVIGIYGGKSGRRGLFRSGVNAWGLTEEVRRKPGGWSAEEESGHQCVAVECVVIWKNTSAEGGCLVCN